LFLPYQTNKYKNIILLIDKPDETKEQYLKTKYNIDIINNVDDMTSHKLKIYDCAITNPHIKLIIQKIFKKTIVTSTTLSKNIKKIKNMTNDISCISANKNGAINLSIGKSSFCWNNFYKNFLAACKTILTIKPTYIKKPYIYVKCKN